MKRFSLAPIIRRHYSAFRAAGSRSMPLTVMATLFIVPLLLGSVVGVFATEIPAAALTPILAASGVLTGAFLAGFVLLTNLRLKIREDEALSYRLTLTRLVGETAVTALYLVITCLAAIIFGVTMVVFGPAMSVRLPVAGQSGVALFAALLVHIGATALTFLRRMFSVYEQLFRSDFSPRLTSVRIDEQNDKAV